MTKTIYKKLFLLLFVAWIIIWINFLLRDLTKGKYLKEYKILLSRDDIGKRSWTYGDRLFEFLEFAEKSVPVGASYDLVGVDESSVDFRRVIYYLYPHFKEDRALYVLVFDKSGYKRDGYIVFKELDPSRFILKRI
jgi:hypothetical protein